MSRDDLLHPSLRDPALIDALRATWREHRSVRVAAFVADEVARALRDELRGMPATLSSPEPGGFRYQYSIQPMALEDDCDHLMCRFGRWLWSDGAAWVGELTGLALEPPVDRILLATLYQKGSYLDPHNDYDGARKVAFIHGLTEDVWPGDAGGHLQFLAFDDAAVRITERRAPGWNSLDLFEVTAPDRLHEVPVITQAVERRAFAGWFY